MALRKGRLDSERMEQLVGADVWRERYKEHQDWIETMTGALPKLASTDKDERSLYAGRLDNSRMELLKLPPGVNRHSGPAGVNTRKRVLQKTPRPHRVDPWSFAEAHFNRQRREWSGSLATSAKVGAKKRVTGQRSDGADQASTYGT